MYIFVLIECGQLFINTLQFLCVRFEIICSYRFYALLIALRLINISYFAGYVLEFQCFYSLIFKLIPFLTSLSLSNFEYSFERKRKAKFLGVIYDDRLLPLFCWQYASLNIYKNLKSTKFDNTNTKNADLAPLKDRNSAAEREEVFFLQNI